MDRYSETLELLTHGQVHNMGRVPGASNETHLVIITHRGQSMRAIYKPDNGAKPLSDFDVSTLSNRERAAFVLSTTLGVHCVPPTVIRTTFRGRGSLQAYVEMAPGTWVDVVDNVPMNGWLPVVEAENEAGETVFVVHRDDSALRAMAIFDLIINNADRKAGHITFGHFVFDGCQPTVFGIDHGLTFHHTFKVRTVLWGFAGDAFSASESAIVQRGLASELGELEQLLAPLETDAVLRRLEALAQFQHFPAMPMSRYPIPWPIF